MLQCNNEGDDSVHSTELTAGGYTVYEATVTFYVLLNDTSSYIDYQVDLTSQGRSK